MKSPAILAILAASVVLSDAADEIIYTNYLRQFQTPSNVVWDASATVASFGSQPSDLAINPGGARFELWTVANTTPPVSYLLSTAYVGTYVPVATVAIRSEDPYALLPRTRVDRPFYVDIMTSGLLNGAADPPASKSVKFTRHVQSYGVGGNGININRTQATLLTQSFINTNGTQTITIPAWGTSIPGADPLKIRGEERFTVFSIEDSRTGSDGLTYLVPETEIASKFVQVWPMAEATLSGISQNEVIRGSMPNLTMTLTDLYPSSTTYAQVYQGDPQLGMTGTVVPGSSLVIDDSVPQSPPAMPLREYDAIFNVDGRWTMETATPFGIDRLVVISFDVQRTLQVNGALTTIE
jgi:hypothetical protein